MLNRPDISVELALENDRFKRELQESVGLAERSLGGLKGAAGGAALALKGLGLGLSAGAVAAFVKEGIDAADTMSKMAQRAGVTTEAFSELTYAANLADVSQQSLQNSLTLLGRKADEAARGVKSSADQFRRLGVDVLNADGSLKSVEDLFADVAEAIAKLPDGAEKSARAMGVLGRSGAQLVPLLNGGRAGLKEAADEAQRFGKVISTEAGRAAEEFKDNLTRLGERTSGVGIQLANDLLPALNDIVLAFGRGYDEGGLFLGILEGMQDSAGQLFDRFLTEDLEDKREQLDTLIERLQYLQGAGWVGAIDKAFNDALGKDRSAEIDETISQINKLNEEILAIQTDQERGANAGSGKRTTRKPTGQVEDEAAAEAAAKAAQTARERILKAQESALSNLRKQLELQGENNELAKVEADIRFGSARQFDKATQDELRQLADKVDRLNEEAEVHEYLIKLEQERRAEAAKTAEAVSAERARTIEALRTPEEQYSAEVRKLMELGIGGEDLQRGIDKARESLEAARDTTKDTTDAARDLGLAFQSAFSDAVIEMRDFEDVLKGLLQDLVSVGLNELVTKPLGNAFVDLLGGAIGGGGGGAGGIGAFFSGLFGNANGGLYRVGGAGTAERPVMLTAQPGETVAVGRFAEGGAGKTTVNIINPPAQPQVRESVIDGEKKIDIVFNRSFGRSLSRGDLAGAGLPPPLASR